MEFEDIVEGVRVMAFDSAAYVDDVSTPLSVTMKPATVIRRYGYKYPTGLSSVGFWIYPDMVDIKFDHKDGEDSKFTNGVRVI